jgi:hypothetical protein
MLERPAGLSLGLVGPRAMRTDQRSQLRFQNATLGYTLTIEKKFGVRLGAMHILVADHRACIRNSRLAKIRHSDILGTRKIL